MRSVRRINHCYRNFYFMILPFIRRFLHLLYAALIGFGLLSSWVGSAHAEITLNLPDSKTSDFSGNKQNFPPADEAFQVDVIPQADHVLVIWQIMPETYLYRHALDFSTNNPHIELGEAEIPDGERYKDEYFGEVETYRFDLQVKVPVQITAGQTAESVDLVVKYQGCADAGICYIPQQQTSNIKLEDIDASTTSEAWWSAWSSAPDVSSLSLIDCLRFFILGILLGFTPCVFPMAPILSRIIVGPTGITKGKRALGLSLAYILSTAAVFAVAGAIIGAVGSGLVAQLQHPIAYLIFAVLFVLLALSMFGLYKLELPSRLQTHITALSNRQKPGSYWGAVGMGVLAAFLISGCATPVLFAVLLEIAQSGDALKGALALFILALGMGAPLVLLATVAGRFLPHAGTWMQQIQTTIGIIMLALALLMLHRVFDWSGLLWVWAGLYVLAAIILLRNHRHGWKILIIAWLGITAIAYFAARPWLQASIDHYSEQWSSMVGEEADTTPRLEFHMVKGLDGLSEALNAAVVVPGYEAAKSQPPVPTPHVAMLDFYAIWCAACLEMEHTTFQDPGVLALTNDVLLLKTDIFNVDEQDRALMEKYQVPTPPAILFWTTNAKGEWVEQPDLRIVGKISTEAFIEHLQTVKAQAAY